MAIFVDVNGLNIKVTGDTYPLNKFLGTQGLGFKFNRDKKSWKGNLSLKALVFLEAQSGAILTGRALNEMQALQEAARKREDYMRRKI